MLLQSIAMSCSLLVLSSTATYAMEEYKVEEGKSKTVAIKPAISSSTSLTLDPKEIDVCAKKVKAKLQASEIEARKKAIMVNVATFFTSGMKSKDRTNIIEMLLEIAPDQITALAANAHVLIIPFDRDPNCFMIIDALYPATPGEIHAIAKKARTFFTADMGNSTRGRIINRLLQGSPEQAAAIIENAERFLTPAMDDNERTFVIQTLLQGTPGQINTIAAKADELFTADMDGYARAQIISEMVALTEEEVELRMAAIEASVDKFFTESMEDGDLVLTELMRATPDQINAIATNAHKLFTPEMSAERRAGKIRQFRIPNRRF